MLISDLLGWWYSRGWAWAAHHIFVVQTERIFDYFSIKDLALTLLAPFRQDVVDTRRAPLGVKAQLFVWNIISRFFGLIIRSSLIIIGLLALAFEVTFGIVAMIVWPLLPLSPVVAVILIGVGLSS